MKKMILAALLVASYSPISSAYFIDPFNQPCAPDSGKAWKCTQW